MKHFKSNYDGMSPKASRQACQLPPFLPGSCQANTNSAPSGWDANPTSCGLSFKSRDGRPGALPPGLDVLGPAFVTAGLHRANLRPREDSASVCLHFPSHCPWAMSQQGHPLLFQCLLLPDFLASSQGDTHHYGLDCVLPNL